ncbi:hypothetical protein CDL12_15525 [Handroanthus impetiginosus]|uniref:Uncharacterized protein n=1 Tax=Handroanthus impetiginosus TaxID=429701 RepID=A0A2G9H2Z9_9LAMI|nr:hypothetical protein CDL12_15525 [Handroanthus impetiginosus]
MSHISLLFMSKHVSPWPYIISNHSETATTQNACTQAMVVNSYFQAMVEKTSGSCTNKSRTSYGAIKYSRLDES